MCAVILGIRPLTHWIQPLTIDHTHAQSGQWSFWGWNRFTCMGTMGVAGSWRERELACFAEAQPRLCVFWHRHNRLAHSGDQNMLFDLLGRKHNNPFPRPADSPGFGCHRPLIASFLDTPPSSLPRFNCTLWLFITIHTDPAFQAR